MGHVYLALMIAVFVTLQSATNAMNNSSWTTKQIVLTNAQTSTSKM